MIDVYASEPQFYDHLRPIWDVLDGYGSFYVTAAVAQARRLKPYDSGITLDRPPTTGGPVMIASFQDSRQLRQRPRIYVEHGTGQTYDPVHCPHMANHGSYSGGEGHDGTILFVCPSQDVADRWRNRYPDVATAAVGCPRLDDWHSGKRPCGDGATVAFSFHWDGSRFCPEAGWAFEDWRDALPGLGDALRARGLRPMGHGHPRAFPHIRPYYEMGSFELEEDFGRVLDRTAVYCVDNSSTAFEMMATGRPVVWLDSSAYRRDVEHGGRFWRWADAGPEVRTAEELLAVLPHLDDWAQRREVVAQEVYAYTDGTASARAAEAIREVIGAG